MGNLYLYASTACVMTHRWRVVTRDRDKKSHCNLFGHEAIHINLSLPGRENRKMWKLLDRNLTYKSCIGTHECSQTIRMNVHKLCRVRVHRDVWCAGYMKLACSTVFVCVNYSAKKWHTNFKIKIRQLIVQNYKLSSYFFSRIFERKSDCVMLLVICLVLLQNQASWASLGRGCALAESIDKCKSQVLQLLGSFSHKLCSVHLLRQSMMYHSV